MRPRTKSTKGVSNSNFEPSPAKQIRFPDGTVMNLNRAQRRRMKIYNRDLHPEQHA